MKRLSEISTVSDRSADEPATECGWPVNLLPLLQKLPREPVDGMKEISSGKHISQTDKDVKRQDACLSVSQGVSNAGG